MRSGTATATASATAASSHHNQEGAPVVAEDGAAADDKVVGDGDGVGDGLGDSVTVGVGDGLSDSVTVGLDGTVAVGVRVGVSGRIGDRVGLGAVAVGVSDCIGDRVRLGIASDGGPGSIGDRVGLGIVSVGVGGEIAERDGVTGSSGEPFPSHEMTNSAAAVRPTARNTSGIQTALPKPALVITSPFSQVRICWADSYIGGSRERSHTVSVGLGFLRSGLGVGVTLA